MSSPYLELPTRSLAELRTELLDERHGLLLAQRKARSAGYLPMADYLDQKIAFINRRLENLETAHG